MSNEDIFAKYGPVEPDLNLDKELEQQQAIEAEAVGDLEQSADEISQEDFEPTPFATGPEDLEAAQTIDADTRDEAAAIWEQYGPATVEEPELEIEEEMKTWESPEPVEMNEFLNDGSLVGQMVNDIAQNLVQGGQEIAETAADIWEKHGPAIKHHHHEQEQTHDEPER